MAVKDFEPAKLKLKAKNKKRFLYTFIVFIIVTVFCFGCKIWAGVQIDIYKGQIAEVQQKVDDINKETEENKAVINSTDRGEFYVKIARDYYQYAKPGEYVFYKTES